MAQERIDHTPREIKFGGEKAASIRRGFAITTLRNPKPSYDFEQGEVILADCFDDNEKVAIVVLTNETKSLKDFSVPQLALDGFFGAEHAARGMSEWPGYEATTLETKMQAITFISLDTFKKLPAYDQKELISNDFDVNFENNLFRSIFYPTIASQIAQADFGFENWILFMKQNCMISRWDQMIIRKARKENAELTEYYLTHPDAFFKLSITPTFRLFRPFILGLPEE